MAGLHRRWRDMSSVSSRFFLVVWASSYSTFPAVVTHMAHANVIDDDGLVVDTRHAPDVVNGSVVKECSVVPISGITDSDVTEPVVNSAIESDLRAPVTLIKNEDAIGPAPITWGPEEARIGNHYPRTRNPKISIVAVVGPISGRPDVAIGGAQRLVANRQRGGAIPMERMIST